MLEQQKPHAMSRWWKTGFDGIQRHSTANPLIYGGFGCIRAQIGGGTPQKPFHPHILLRICRYRVIHVLNVAAEGADRRPQKTPTAMTTQTIIAEMPMKHGGGCDLSPGCHPVPPFHPHRHALLEGGPQLRVMTGPEERFEYGEQTKADREGRA